MPVDVIGLIPAGGQATRIAPLPCSKELYPIGFRTVEEGVSRPKVVCFYLLERMRLAGIKKAFIVLREGKWDIPAYFNDGTMLDMNLGYLMMRLPFGSPYTLDQAYPFVQGAVVAMGFPDILFQPDDAFVQLLERRESTAAEVVVGLFPTSKPHKSDMVELEADGRVRRIVIKPTETRLQYTWMIAVWGPEFTQFMHEYLATVRKEFENSAAGGAAAPGELYVGDVIQAALDRGFRVDSVTFPTGSCLDIGTPEDLIQAVRQFSVESK